MNTANNKNYMSSLAAEECDRRFSQQQCIARQCAAPKSSPAYSSVRQQQGLTRLREDKCKQDMIDSRQHENNTSPDMIRTNTAENSTMTVVIRTKTIENNAKLDMFDPK